jgi:hypothetical protein
MTPLGVVVRRRGRAWVDGREVIVELVRAYELRIAPSPGMVLVFKDGTPRLTVSQIIYYVGLRPEQGVTPPAVELCCAREQQANLEALTAWAEAAVGWQPVTPPAPAPASV